MLTVKNLGQVDLESWDLAGEEGAHPSKARDDGERGKRSKLVVSLVQVLQTLLNVGSNSEIVDNDVFEVVVKLERFRNESNSRVTFRIFCRCRSERQQ